MMDNMTVDPALQYGLLSVPQMMVECPDPSPTEFTVQIQTPFEQVVGQYDRSFRSDGIIVGGAGLV